MFCIKESGRLQRILILTVVGILRGIFCGWFSGCCLLQLLHCLLKSGRWVKEIAKDIVPGTPFYKNIYYCHKSISSTTTVTLAFAVKWNELVFLEKRREMVVSQHLVQSLSMALQQHGVLHEK